MVIVNATLEGRNADKRTFSEAQREWDQERGELKASRRRLIARLAETK